MALENCQGEILVICNSCNLGGLVSDRWTLLCSAHSEQPAEALSESGSGYFRGSAFTACVVAQAAQEYGLRVPLPRAEPRSLDAQQHVWLPTSLPPHSFSTPGIATLILRPSDISLAEFLRRMINMKQFLVENRINIFQAMGSRSMVTWTNILPFKFTGEIVGLTSLKADSADYSTRFNATVLRAGLQGLPPTLVSHNPAYDPILVRLVVEISKVDVPWMEFDVFCANISRNLVQHISDPEHHECPLQPRTISAEGLLYILWSIHVQAVAAQEIARELGWCDATKDAISPFLPPTRGISEVEEMMQHGVKINELLRHFACRGSSQYVLRFDSKWLLTGIILFRMRGTMDYTSAQWLAVKWVAAGRPVISRPEWDLVAKKVDVLTEGDIIMADF